MASLSNRKTVSCLGVIRCRYRKLRNLFSIGAT